MQERYKKEGRQGIFTNWNFWGKNVELGGKTEDLLTFAKTKPELVQVLPGEAFDVSFWFDFLDFNQLSRYSNHEPKAVLEGEIPPSLSSVNQEIIKRIPERTILVLRSSAVGEKGGIGVYSSQFLITTGDKEQDLELLAQAEKSVYSSYFSPEAKAYRQKTEATNEGMGLLLQPVLGRRFGNYFLPVLSGVCYEEDGEQKMRLVIGLGTRAVDLNQAVIVDKKMSFQVLKQRLASLSMAEGINLTTGEVEEIPISDDLKELALNQACFTELVWLELIKDEQLHYWEFVINDDEDTKRPVIVQNSLGIDSGREIELAEPEGEVLFEGEDMVNRGIKRGRGIMFAMGNSNDFTYLEGFNQGHKGFLLIVPDTAFSRFFSEKPTISYEHFSNAAVVVELQYPPRKSIPGLISPTVDHSNKRGGTHFSELCKRTDILFIGVQADKFGSFEDILGQATERPGESIDFWNVEFKATSTKDVGRVEVLGQPEVRKYSHKDFFSWADEFYHLGCSLEKAGEEDKVLSVSFFEVMDLFIEAESESQTDFDPFRFLKKLDQEKAVALLGHLQKVKENLFMLESYADFEEYSSYDDEERVFPLEEYLNEVEERLGQLLKR